MHVQKVLVGTLLVLGWAGGSLHGASVELQPAQGSKTVAVEGASAWQGRRRIFFDAPPPTAGLDPSGSLYARVTYLDEGQGLLQVSRRTTSERRQSTTHTRSSRVNMGGFVTSYHALPKVPADEVRGSKWLELRLIDGKRVPLTVRSVTVQDEPFADPAFQETLAKPWQEPPRFAPPATLPAPTLKGRVMAGYQGWFRTPNDRDDQGWGHWFRSKTDPDPANYTFDMWPETRDYAEGSLAAAGPLVTRSGQPARLFSSTSEAVVQNHFALLRRYGIDGAFLQRFLTTRPGGDDGTAEWVLQNVRKAANDNERLWAIEYDVSGMPPARAAEVLQRDWSWLKDVLKVVDDPFYARQNGKPVVFIWGLPFPDRNFTPEIANRILRFFQEDPRDGGNYVIGSLPNQWETLPREWLAHARRYDGLQVWQSHDYAVDERACEPWKLDYYPHVWPGFSWAHLTRKQEPAAFTDRAGGTYFRRLIAKAFEAGADRLFVGMFDEYDEGTAILPMSDDPPPPGPPAGRFLTNGEDPPDLWLSIAADAKRALTAPHPAQAFSSDR